MTDILGAQPINEYGPLVTAISNPSATLIPIFMPDGTGAHASAQALLDNSNQTIVAYLTSGATAEWVSGAYAKATTLHYTDPAKLVSGTYVAGAAVAAGVVPPALPWLLSALDGKDGVSAVSIITTTRPNVPAVGSDAIYSVGSAAGYGIGMYVDIINASATSLGTFLIVGITTTSLTLRNVTAIATTTVSTGFTVVASGKPGTNGTNGTSGTSAIAVTTGANAVTPAVGASQAYNFISASGLAIQQYYGFTGIAGTFLLTAIATNSATLQNVDASVGSVVPAGTVLAPVGKTGAPGSGGGSGGATGIKYTLNTTAGTPAAGEIRSTNLAVAGTIAISATDAATPGKSAADILARIKVGAIIEIAESLTKRIRATVTTDYTVGSGSFVVSTPLVDGAIGNGAIVFLSIASGAPSTSTDGGFSAGTILATGAAGSVILTELTPPSGSSRPGGETYAWYRSVTAGFPINGTTLLSGATGVTLNDTGLLNNTTYRYCRVVSDALGNKAATPEVVATTDSSVVLYNAIKITITAAQDFSTVAGTSEIELYSTIGGTNVATGGTVTFTAQGSASGHGSASQSFDGITAPDNNWFINLPTGGGNQNFPQSITYTFASPKSVVQVGMAGFSGTAGSAFGPNIGAFSVYGSTDGGASFNLLKNISGTNFPANAVQRFTL
jgi:hypothetical protein